MQRFYLERHEDVSGVSGTGRIAEGVVFANGKVALSWLTQYHSIGIYDSLEQCRAIHGHDGKTDFVLHVGAGDMFMHEDRGLYFDNIRYDEYNFGA